MEIQKRNEKKIQKIEQLTEKNRRLLEESIPESTKRAYRSDWNQFTSWCKANGFERFPSTPEIIALYLTDISDQYKPRLHI